MSNYCYESASFDVIALGVGFRVEKLESGNCNKSDGSVSLTCERCLPIAFAEFTDPVSLALLTLVLSNVCVAHEICQRHYTLLFDDYLLQKGFKRFYDHIFAYH